jgi:microcystin degradation protein MlrC
MRIALAGVSHEALTTSPLPTTLKDFRVVRGTALVDHVQIADTLRQLDVEPVPILYAGSLTPSGTIELSTYLGLRDEIIAGLRAAGPLDGICLILHGAMVVEHIGSGETDLVREIRALVGNDVPIAVRLDPHANITDEFASKVDLFTCYRTAPHRDVRETLARALALLVRSIRAKIRPRPAFIRIPLLLPGERSTTGIDPMKSLLAMAADVEREEGVLNADVLIGFGWADAPFSAASVVVTAAGDVYLPKARAAAYRLASTMWECRRAFHFDQEVASSIDEAIDRALRAPERTVFLTDSGDNVTAGAPGDVPTFTARLLVKGAPDAVVAGLCDEAAVRACLAAGVGATVSVALGGKIDTVHAPPLPVTGVVEHLYQPAPEKQEPTIATLRIDGTGVLVTDIRWAFATLDEIRKAGVEPLDHKIIVHKLGYLLPHLRDAAPREIMALSEGFSDLEYTRLPYRYVIRPIFPLDDAMTWRPLITNVAGYTD